MERKKENLEGKNIIVYDLEIANSIDKSKGIGWKDHDKMGLSVGALYDYETGDYTVYFNSTDDIQRLCGRINRAALVVAFNHIGFDNKLLRAIGGDLKPDSELKNYDMLLESRKAAHSTPFKPGFKLDQHLEATFGQQFKKTAHGELAPIWWQEGRKGEVTSYCLADVRREKSLFEYIWENGGAKTMAYGFKKFELGAIEFAVNAL